jgi:DNA-binding cell septation regulator SpoVG
MSIEVKVNRIHKITTAQKSLRAFADVEINGVLIIKGLQVLNGVNGIFVSMPRHLGKDNKWHEVVRILIPELKRQINSIVLSAYETQKG